MKRMIIAVRVLWFLLVQMAIAAEMPTAKELLDRFSETVDKAHTSFITKSKSKLTADNKFAGKWGNIGGKETKYLDQEFRTDGERMKSLMYKLGENMAENEKSFHTRTHDGEKSYQYATFMSSPGRVFIDRHDKQRNISYWLSFIPQDAACFGHFDCDIERFDHILKRAKFGQVSVRNQMEDINGVAHYVIDAKTNHGQYTVWLNPEKGYNFSKAVVVKEPGDLFKGEYKAEPGCPKRFIIENTQFKDVNGVWVPVKAKKKVHYILPNNSCIRAFVDIELLSILINPKHDALGSFRHDEIKDGAKVGLVGQPGEYIWKDGKPVNKKNGRVVLDCKKISAEPNKIKGNLK